MDRRQSAPLAATQLPAGADTLTSAPKLEYPTGADITQARDRHDPGTTVLQLAGSSTGPLALPAETTTRTPKPVTVPRALSYAAPLALAQASVPPPRLRFTMSAGYGFGGTAARRD